MHANATQLRFNCKADVGRGVQTLSCSAMLFRIPCCESPGTWYTERQMAVPDDGRRVQLRRYMLQGSQKLTMHTAFSSPRVPCTGQR